MGDFKLGNSAIANLYFGNIPVAQVYFGNTLVWEKTGDVPYDNTCTVTITLSQDKTAWIVTVTKDGENVTSSLSQITTWIYDGTGVRVNPQRVNTNIIDLSQKPRGDYRVDLAQITSKAGGYFPGTGVISVPEHIYIGNLLAGSQNVAIELDLTNETSNLTVNSIEIFTSQTGSATSGLIKILHESGIYVGAIDGNNEDSSTERYHLTGRPRTVSNVGVTLYAGEKYYLVFHDSNASTYYPAYFQNENGNYIANFTDSSQAISLYPYQNITVIKDYLPAGGGDINEADLQSILKLDTDELFLWNGHNLVVNSTNLIRDDHLGKKLTAKITNPPITTSDADIWSYADKTIFVRHGYGSNVVDRIWKKTTTTTKDGTFTITSSAGDVSCAQVLLALKNGTSSYSKILTQTSAQYDMWYNYIGSNMSIKSGYKVGLTDMTPLTTVPQNPGDKTFYYFAQSIAESTVGVWHDCIVLYENNSWHSINPYGKDDFIPYLNIQTLDSVIEQVSLTTLVQEDQQVSCNSSIKSATISTDKKFYLKINGKEV